MTADGGKKNESESAKPDASHEGGLEAVTLRELDPDEKTLVVPSIYGSDTEIIHPADSATIVKVPMPVPPIQRRPQPSPPQPPLPQPPAQQARRPLKAQGSENGVTFFESEADIDKALSRLSEAEAPLAPARIDAEASGEIRRDRERPEPGFAVSGDWSGEQRVELFGDRPSQRGNGSFLLDGPAGPSMFDTPVVSEPVDDRLGQTGGYAADPPRSPARAQSPYSLLPLAPPPLPPPPPSRPADYWAGDPGAMYGAGSYLPVGPLMGPTPQMADPVRHMMTPQYPGYAGPNPYLMQPLVTKPASGMRWVVAVVLAIGTTGLGLGAGWLLFATQGTGDDDILASASLPQEASTVAPVGASQTPVPATPAATPAPAGAAVAPIIVDITSLDHPELPPLISPQRGELTLSALPSARRVAKGEKLFEIKRKVSSDGQAELAARVAELRRLAQEDPVYEAFLARARDEYRRTQRTEIIAIKAGSDALAEPRAARGDRLEQGQTLATMTDPQMWTAKASSRGGGVSREWRCGIASADDSYRAICRIEQVAVNQTVAEVTASVEASQVPWLRTLEQRPRLVLEPPAGSPAAP